MAPSLGTLIAVVTFCAALVANLKGITAIPEPMTKLSASFRRLCLIVEKLAIYLAPLLSSHTFNA